MMREAIVVAVTVFIALLATIGYQLIVGGRAQPRLGVVDILAVAEAAQRSFEKVGFDPKASESERTQAIVAARAFGLQLDQAVAHLARQCQCVLLNRSAVVGAGGAVAALPDFTADLRAALAQRGAISSNGFPHHE